MFPARHARIEPTKDGYYVIDMQSTNGTFVNDNSANNGNALLCTTATIFAWAIAFSAFWPVATSRPSTTKKSIASQSLMP